MSVEWHISLQFITISIFTTIFCHTVYADLVYHLNMSDLADRLLLIVACWLHWLFLTLYFFPIADVQLSALCIKVYFYTSPASRFFVCILHHSPVWQHLTTTAKGMMHNWLYDITKEKEKEKKTCMVCCLDL